MMQRADAIVVGSGMTGGWVAKELTEAGLQTVLVEAGGPVSVGDDFVDDSCERLEEAQQPIQSQCYACDGPYRRLFVSDSEHPYLSSGPTPFAWIRGRHLGGRSLAWARHCFRFADFDFEADAAGTRWPFGYDDLEPWYTRVERWIGIAGQRDGLRQVPDSDCLPGFGLNAAEDLFRTRLSERFRGERQLIVSRVATLSVPHAGRPAYRPREYQTHPIQDAAHFSSLSSTIPAAYSTGRLRVQTNSIVSRVCHDSRSGLVSGVEVIDRLTRQVHELRAPLIVLAAGALESTRILLNSGGTEFPEGLANSSGCLGRYLMDHLTGLGATGVFPELQGKLFRAGRPTTTYVPRFRNLNRDRASFSGGYAFICDAFRPSAAGTAVFREAAGLDKAVAEDWAVRLWGFGECLPCRDNRVTLDTSRRDRWGVPTLKIAFSWSDNDIAMARDMATSAAEMLEAAGARNIRLLDKALDPGLAIHEMGTVRMGNDPRKSVVNGFGQCHDVPNLFVVDGAILPTSPCQNPSLTYMALASRAACYAAAALRNGHLTAR
jgi:choline dehydrogenase-like flavoprotein